MGEELPADSPAIRARDRGCCDGLRLDGVLGGSLRARYDGSVALLEEWRGKREARLREWADLQAETYALKARLGHPALPSTPSKHAKADITRANMEYLRGVLSTCHAERIRKERDLEALLGTLRKLCTELGEDDVQAASATHPSLALYWQSRAALPSRGSGFGSGSGSEAVDAGEQEQPEIDLCDETFNELNVKIDELKHLRDLRDQQSRDLSELLESLWAALDTPDDDIDRGIFTRLMEGSSRLHARSIEQGMAEVSRLEQCKTQHLEDRINEKIIDLQELCIETHLPMPDLSPLLGPGYDPTEGFQASESNVGQIADVMAKISRMVVEVQTIVTRRSPIIGMIMDLEAAREEADWLHSYENDGDRYKGRDCNRKLQRAIKAGRIRDRMPEKVEELRALITEWEQEEGCPFIFEDVDYCTTMLDAVMEEWNARMAQRAAGRANSRAARRRTPQQPTPHASGGGDRTPRGQASAGQGERTPREGGRRGWGGATRLSSANVRTLEASQAENTVHEKVSRMLKTPSPSLPEDFGEWALAEAGGKQGGERAAVPRLSIPAGKPGMPPLFHNSIGLGPTSQNPSPSDAPPPDTPPTAQGPPPTPMTNLASPQASGDGGAAATSPMQCDSPT
ncbi:unnamed protein product [Ostreobium quekettii]|uniref:Uncharacterized protein n=1 Tax=Ostreobium quekettii TaxID=121088 RepID=A0A8S1IUH8_9CHLO|nr:unnamed protein product [Ostreobium quekettii]